MTKISIDESTMERLLEEQEKQRKERRKQRRLSHVDESELFEPAKRKIESDYCPDSGNIIWYEEPDIHVRKPETDEPASRVTERPDLLCEWRPDGGGPSTLYIIELKKRINKRGIGQLTTYYWAARNGSKIIDGSKEYTLTGEEMIVMILAGIKYKKQYYDEVIEWITGALDVGSRAGIEVIPIEHK